MTADTLTGGCACGALRYAITGTPVVMLDCQCRDCQRESGNGHASHVVFRNAKVTVTGPASLWTMQADSGNSKTRGFCPTCGAPVYMTFAAIPDTFAVRAASLDDPSHFAPHIVTYHARALAWDRIDPDLPTFAGMPG